MDTLHADLYSMSLNSSYNAKCFRQKLQRKLQHILCSTTYWPPPTQTKKIAVCDVQKHATARQVEDGKMAARTRTNVTFTHTYLSRETVIPSMSMSSKWSPSLTFPHQKAVHIPLLPHTRIMRRPFKPPLFHYPTIMTRINNESSHYAIVSKLLLRHPTSAQHAILDWPQ